MKTLNLLVTVSGGRSSAMSAFHIFTSIKYAKYRKLFVFCNTGQERVETIEFLKNIKNIWGIPLHLIEGVYSTDKGVGVRYKVVDFENLNMNSVPFAGAIMQLNKNKNTGVPNQAIPYCSEYLKTRPAHRFAVDYFGGTNYIKVLGFRKEDMPKRITLKELSMLEDKMLAPLLTDFGVPVGMLELNVFYKSQPFKLKLHSKFGNCQLCFKKSKSNLLQSIQYGVDCVPFYSEMERKYGNTFFRSKLKVSELVEMAERSNQLSFDNDVFFDGCVCNF